MPRRPRRTTLPLLPLLVLCGCAGATNIKSVKAPDYDKAPHRLMVVLPAGQHYLEETFKRSLTAELSLCGASTQFAAAFDPAHARAGGFDAVMTARPLGEETVTVSKFGVPIEHYTSKARFEFSLIDADSQRNVWKEQIDFTSGNPDSIFRIGQAPVEETWAKVLVESMAKDGISCAPGTGTASGTAAVAPAGPVMAAAPMTPPETPAPTPITPAPDPIPTTPVLPVAPPAPPSSPAIAVAPLPPRPAPPAVPVAGDGFIVDGVAYPTSAEALRALRQIADRNLAQTAPVGPPIDATLLVVIPDPEANAPVATRQSNEKRVYAMTQREIQNQAYVRALRRLGPFKSVMTARPSEIHVGDFRGAAFKLWRDETAGVWVLTSTKGGEQRFEVVPGDDGNDLPSMLEKVQAAADSLFR